MRRLPLVGGAVPLAVLIAYLVVWTQVSPVRQRGTDFSVDYVAAALIRDGRAAELYDQRLEAERHAALLPAGIAFNLPFIGPPTAALLTVPVTVTDPETAYRIWSLLQLAMLVGAALLATRGSPWRRHVDRDVRLAVCLMALASPATLVLLLMGQWDGLLALALASGYVALRAQRPVAAGVVLGLAFAATKPHLALGLAAFLLARRDWRAVAGAAGGVGLAALTSLLLVGTTGLAAFAGALGSAFSNTPPQSTLGLAGLVSSWLGSGAVTASLVAAGSLLALGGCAVLGQASRATADTLAPALGGATALSLLIAPHLLAHDLALLVPAMVWCTAWYAARSSGEVMAALVVWLGVGCVVAMDTGSGGTGPPGRLVPWALVALGAGAAHLARHRGMTASRPPIAA